MNDKLRLCKNLILIGLPLAALMAVNAMFPMSYFTEEYPMWAEERDFVRDSSTPSYETLIIGDSRAKSGLIPLEFDQSGETYNIAIGGATAIEMYYALGNYLKDHKAPKRAFVVFAPYHFCDIDNFDQTLYYNYLKTGEILELEGRALKSEGSERVAYKGWVTDVISYKLRFPQKYLAAVYEALPHGNRAENTVRYDSVRSSKGHTLFGEEEANNGPSYEVHHEMFDSSELVLEYYDRLLKRLEDEGTEVIIEQAPLNPYSYDNLKPEFVSGLDEFFAGIKEEYPGFIVVKEIPRYDMEYFGDNNHLNKKGAEKFTEEIKEKYF